MSLDFTIYAQVPSRMGEVYSRNITHNLIHMADLAGLYDVLWHPVENGYRKAKDIIPRLRIGILLLKSDPERFKKFNPNNGWGTYEGLLDFAEAVLETCLEYPEGVLDTRT